MGRRRARRFSATGVGAAAALLVGLLSGFPAMEASGSVAPVTLAAAPRSTPRSAGHAAATRSGGVSPITNLSARCRGQNAEVEEATAAPSYVYVEWIGCGGEGFARSTNGGKTFSRPITLPGSARTFDPAVAVGPHGTVYAAFMKDRFPVVDASFNHGASFTYESHLPVPFKGTWADRDFIAVAPNGTIYVTWDYGPTAAAIRVICNSSGSCGYSAGDLNAVIQRSTDGGKTWSQITPMGPNFPENGGEGMPLVVEPSGKIDVLAQNPRVTNPITYKLAPGHEKFMTSTDGGRTWSSPLVVGPGAGTMSLAQWWIDGDIGIDSGGNLYATWDTQMPGGDIGWLSYSPDHGRTWSSPIRVTPDHDHAMHNVEVVGGASGVAYVAWQTDASPLGYATFIRPYSIKKGWLAPSIQVSRQFGSKKIWPGDTFGISVLPTTAGGRSSVRLSLTWGSAIKGHRDSEIYGAVVTLPRQF